jgi:redox-sensitive bicupin YhaK (pirin superfamily)
MGLLALKLTAKTAPVGDFSVLRALPQRERRLVGPFCFLDHMGPHTAVAQAGGGVGPHPHIGLSTVTYLFEGSALHRDSLGTQQLITPGDVNWMTAGRGIVHSERPPADTVGRPATLHGLQVWVALPLEAEDAQPAFQHVPKALLPLQESGGASTRVVLGAWHGAQSPVHLASPTFYVVSQLEQGAELELSTEHSERALYVIDGAVGVGGEALARGELAVLTTGEAGCVTALTRATVAVLGGAPLEGPRLMWWNFVSSRRERLEQAKADWQHRRFPTIPGDSADRIPMPGETP